MSAGVSPEFWRRRRTFITGHTGFKGAWLVAWMHELGARVTGFALPPPTDPSLYASAGLARGITSIEGDVRDLDALARSLAEAQPEVVFHLAAQSLVRSSYAEPVETFSTNVMGTVNVLEAVRRVPSVRAVVIVTSDKCYENREWEWGYRESDAMGGHDPYSASKGCAELVTASFRRSFFSGAGAGVASVRAGNVIGGGDWALDRLVPDAMRAFRDNRPLELRNPDSLRPWQHVLDPLAGYMMLAERLVADPRAYADGWNFGPDDGNTAPTRRVADLAVSTWGDGASWQNTGSGGPHEAKLLRLDASRARMRLGWRPRLPLSAAVEWTVEWYRAIANGCDPHAETIKQIAAYERLP